MAYKVIILYRLYMPSYFLGTFTEYPQKESVAKHASACLRRLSLYTPLNKMNFSSFIYALRQYSLTLPYTYR